MLYMQALGKEVPVEGEGEDFAESDYRPFITAAKKARIWAERFMKEGDARLFETVEHISTDNNPLKLGQHDVPQLVKMDCWIHMVCEDLISIVVDDGRRGPLYIKNPATTDLFFPDRRVIMTKHEPCHKVGFVWRLTNER